MTRPFSTDGRGGLGRLDRLAGLDRIPTRRGALGLLGLSGLALAGCGSSGSEDLAQQAQSGEDKGYVSGSGVITQLSGDERGEPLDLDFETLTGESTSLAHGVPGSSRSTSGTPRAHPAASRHRI